jgi:hypothetical protein
VFKEPLRRDPLVVGWVAVMLLAAFVALSSNTTWSGELEADRVAGFLKDVAEAFAWSFFLLLLLAWLRNRGWQNAGSGTRPRSGTRARSARRAPEADFAPFPWTDRWLRDWREVDAQQRQGAAPADADSRAPLTCRHGAPIDAGIPSQQTPVLRALSVNHAIMPPGGSVSVTWCFEHCDDVVVDDRSGYPSCGETKVRIDETRRIGVVGRNRYGSASVATPSVIAMAAPELALPTEMPPPVSLRTDVAAMVGASTPITQRLDAFWAIHDDARPRAAAPPPLAAVPASLFDGLRRAHRLTTEEKQ